MRHYALVVEAKAAPAAGAASSPWGAKKKRKDAKPELGPRPGGTIDGESHEDLTDDEASLELDNPDTGSGADARPYDQTQRPEPVDKPADAKQAAPRPGDDLPAEAGETITDGDTPSWAGDQDDTGDETDPADAYVSFTGPGGEQAWLDRHPDGTLTGWVRAGDGTIYRYSDADAWAIDVDDAGMTKTGGHTPTSSDDSTNDGADASSSPDAATTAASGTPVEGKSLRRVLRTTPAPDAPAASAPVLLRAARGVALRVDAK